VAAKAKQRNFRDIAEDYIEVKSPEWTNAKHAAQWTNTLTEYAYPILGQLLVEDIEAAHIVRVLKPLWDGKKVETGTRLRQRIEKIIDYAIAQGIRTNKENPAMWRGRLIHMLPAPGKIRSVVHHAAMPLQQLGAFMVELRKREGMGAKALDFLTMTAARSGEVRFATWAEIDLKAKLWTVPAEHMKAGEEHRVPLSDQAVALLEAMPRHAESQVIFYSGTGRELSDMTLTKCLRDMGHAATPHGMRSCFRDWASERGYSRELAERALAHAVGSKVEAAYLRTKAVEARRPMMQSWSDFLDRVQPVEGNVADMDAARKKAAA
jgi:integrase